MWPPVNRAGVHLPAAMCFCAALLDDVLDQGDGRCTALYCISSDDELCAPRLRGCIGACAVCTEVGVP